MPRSHRLLALSVAVAAFLWGWPALTSGYEGPYDEGLTLSMASRAAGGEAPYRDFWLLHPPGTTWLLAAAFQAFSPTVGVERGVKLAVAIVAAVLVFLLARRVARPAAATSVALLFVVLPTQTLSLRSRDTGLVLVLATLVAASWPSSRPRRRALVAGLLAGLTTWFKQDFVLAAAVSGAVALGADSFLSAPVGRRRRAFAETLALFGAGLFTCVVSLAATLAAQGTIKEFFEQAILFPATSFGRFRSIPLTLRFEQLAHAIGPEASARSLLEGAAVPVLYGVALAAGLAGAAAGAVAIRRGGDPGGATALATGLATLLLWNGQRVRASLEHANPVLALALVPLAAAVAPRGNGAGRGRAIFGAVGLAAVAAVSMPALATRAREARTWTRSGPEDGWTGLPAAPRWIGLPADVLETARFVASSSAPGERIYVGNARHDVLAYGAPLLYVLSGRTGATRYDNLHPGVATTRSVQNEIVRSLEAQGTRWAVLWDGPPAGEPNESSRSTGVVVLDAWLSSHGRDVARFGAFRVRRLDGTPASPTPARVAEIRR